MGRNYAKQYRMRKRRPSSPEGIMHNKGCGAVTVFHGIKPTAAAEHLVSVAGVNALSTEQPGCPTPLH